ncbi:MAG: hypothetical protein H7A19_08910 [Rhodanobacteraceae bacterium]|nr:hypothetical protein [Rhodanobacteraceae bacterium]
MTDTADALAEQWNALGRQHAAEVQARLARFHRGEVEDPELPADPRDAAMANQVLHAVTVMNQQGRWREARGRFDPAHAPFIPHLGKEGLPFVIALGPDEALFRRGSCYQAGHLWHVCGEKLTPLPTLIAAAISPDRSRLAVADTGGVRIFLGWGGAEVARLPWPSSEQMVPAWVPSALRSRYDVEPPEKNLKTLCVSNSGLRVAVANGNGVLVGTVREGGPSWRLAMPFDDEPDDFIMESLDEDSAGFSADMVHVALSGDGRFLACGTQCDGHHLLALDDDGRASRWAQVGHLSEYPHHACFSHDARWVALNSCHFYHGATIAADVSALQGATTEAYQPDPRAREINSYLRVYAATWLPRGALPTGQPAFALAGASVLTLVTPEGAVQGELMFGSSASGIDYCPASRTLVLGSYSGFLHFLDLSMTDPNAPGWQPPRETKRWCFLPDRAPLQW